MTIAMYPEVLTMHDPALLKRHRPLSPHLQVYRPQITSVMSILHRLTGIVLFFGTLVVALWLWGAAYAPEMFDCLHAAFASTVGTAGMIGWTAAFFYHLFNGIRHMFWDMGKGFALEVVTLTGILAAVLTAIATAAVWFALLGGAS